MNRRILLTATATFLSYFGLVESISAQDAIAGKVAASDTVYRNGFVYTVDGVGSRAQAFAVRDGKFIAVGADDSMDQYVGAETRIVDLEHRMVLPGLYDTHIHPVRGALTSLGLAFPVTSSLDEIKSAVQGYISDNNLAKGDWIEGAKWSLDPSELSASDLDDVSPDNPVFLHDWTNHLAWVNTAALTAAGISKDTPDPAGGVIDRDDSGNPTGILHDKALGLVTNSMPPPSSDVLLERAEWVFGKLNSFGITGIITAQLDPGRLTAYRELESENLLSLRLQGSWDFNTRYVTGTLEEQAEMFVARKDRGDNSPLINVDGVKIYMDGIPSDGEGGAPMIDSYATNKSFGIPSIDEATFSTWMARFDASGLKVMAHATGSLSVRHFLNAVEATRRANGDGPRHHLAHTMLVYPEEVERFGFDRSNFVAEFSPYQLWVPDPTANYEWAKIIGRDRFSLTFSPIRSLIAAGALVSYGSDWDNIPEPNPWFAMEGMVTRQYPNKPEFGQFNPDQRISVESAIEIFTRNGAVAMELEDETGSIEVGKSADFVIIDQNILEVPAKDIHKTKVLKTVLRGHLVYDASDTQSE